ncbi:hypothetical protein Pan54_25180 [Rubinisphaera italica]|uniref:Uncharacterized protein n=1 Tax=Rubinisphaera italica TaxID=2527969 RepID=A0A5C5XH78_9PLAN|nr:hypothetical protein Pan54_25180 [Rubinisphaera italica]
MQTSREISREVFLFNREVVTLSIAMGVVLGHHHAHYFVLGRATQREIIYDH